MHHKRPDDEFGDGSGAVFILLVFILVSLVINGLFFR